MTFSHSHRIIAAMGHFQPSDWPTLPPDPCELFSLAEPSGQCGLPLWNHRWIVIGLCQNSALSLWSVCILVFSDWSIWTPQSSDWWRRVRLQCERVFLFCFSVLLFVCFCTFFMRLYELLWNLNVFWGTICTIGSPRGPGLPWKRDSVGLSWLNQVQNIVGVFIQTFIISDRNTAFASVYKWWIYGSLGVKVAQLVMRVVLWPECWWFKSCRYTLSSCPWARNFTHLASGVCIMVYECECE